ncbi:hypothetical protein [Phascolarctobacterium faecium]|uniref:hypothetical protein n=1 Tax=Phascolarctobacterium faecium TaxID=33025 RepID=UPI003FEFC8DF
MARPSNYRHDPYADIATTIALSERHLVPTVSPYIVELGEVPVKSAPSTVKVKYITAIEGDQLTYGGTLTEVSATPVEGQYFPDYHTNADKNPEWNTGKVMFSAADAGKMVEISYMGKGTLTGVNSNAHPAWWTFRGDGSDGDFCPTIDVTISGGLKQYKSVYIKPGVTVTTTGPVDICCQGAFVNAGTLTATGTGCKGGRGGLGINVSYGGELFNASWGEYGDTSSGGYGGAGGRGNPQTPATLNGAAIVIDDQFINYLMTTDQLCSGCGGSGGNPYLMTSGPTAYNGDIGGRGGGGMQIRCAAFKNTGSIVSNGSPGSGTSRGTGGGGGGGGAIKVVCRTNISTGTITHNGGAGGNGAGAGGPGWHKIIELGAL